MYAIIETCGKQYKVEAGNTIFVDRLGVPEDETVTFDKIIAIGGDGVTDGFKIGSPYIDGASVTAIVGKNGKSKKIIVYKYKAKKGYRKKQGHRQDYTRLEITDIAV